MNNRDMAKRLKESLRLRHEPVAVKLIKEGEKPPTGYAVPDKQMSHCQSVMAARNGQKLLLAADAHSCKNGASALGLAAVPEKTASGEFYHGAGMFASAEAAKSMIDKRSSVPYNVTHTVVAPLKDADFEPDVVVLADIPERIYWLVPMSVHQGGGRVDFNTAPYNAICVDATARPLLTDNMNISLGCFGCRKRTELQADEMLAGIPFSRLPLMMEALESLDAGIMQKAARD